MLQSPPLDKHNIQINENGRTWDGWLLVIVSILLGIGVVMIFSGSAMTSEWRFGDPFHFLKRQILHMIAGFIALYVGLQIDYHAYRRVIYPILGITIGMLLLVILIGHTAGGAKRWISLGFMMFQPGEWTKIAMVMVLAHSLDKKGDKVKNFSIGMLPHLLLVGFVVMLLLRQPDFGTSVIIFTSMFVLLFIAGTRISYILGLGMAGAVSAFILIVNSPYRMKRVMAFLNPWEHRQGIGYQVTESLIAIGSGGMTGSGLGNGLGKLGFVPALETDFIGTAIAEEFGFIGILFIVLLFLLLLWRGLRIAFRSQDRFGTYLALGITVVFELQAVINLGVISGWLPTKGLTLPFVSYGGSSLLCGMFAVGIMLNISKGSQDLWEAKHLLKEEQKVRRAWERKRQKVLKL